MPLSFDPFAFFLAFFAVAMTLFQLWKTYAIIIKIVEAKQGREQSLSENRAQFFVSFELLIRNVGRPLHDVAISLGFRGPGNSGWISIPLRHFTPFENRGDEQHKGEFAPGMVGRFGLKSYQLDYGSWLMISDLKNPVEQNAVLTVYSQGYRAKQLKVGVGLDFLKMQWNQFAWRINRNFDDYVPVKGSKTRFHKSGKVLPVFECLSLPLLGFIRSLKSLPQPPAPPPIDPNFLKNHPFFRPPNTPPTA